VQRYCDRAMLLRNGKVITIGKADEVTSKYLYQNMSDEEKRVYDKKRQEECTEKKSSRKTKSRDRKEPQKIVEILGIKFLDKEGSEKNVFETGEKFSVRVYFKKNSLQEELNFGLALYNQQDQYIVGINTIFDNQDVSASLRRGFFQVDFDDLPFNSDSYYALANIVKDNFNLPYALRRKQDYFRVTNASQNEGIVCMKYKWS